MEDGGAGDLGALGSPEAPGWSGRASSVSRGCEGAGQGGVCGTGGELRGKLHRPGVVLRK